jgi:FkbM family methyltransferase
MIRYRTNIRISRLFIECEVEVKTTTLDAWAKSENPSIIDLLWIDVQGAEKEVLEGAAELLKDVRTETVQNNSF